MSKEKSSYVKKEIIYARYFNRNMVDGSEE